jgi:hypothetical protein
MCKIEMPGNVVYMVEGNEQTMVLVLPSYITFHDLSLSIIMRALSTLAVWKWERSYGIQNGS